MMGGQWFKELFGNPDSVTGESLVEAALQSISDQTGMSSIDPNHYYVNILKVSYINHSITYTNSVYNSINGANSKGARLLLVDIALRYRTIVEEDTIGTAQSVLIIEVSSFRGNLYINVIIWTPESVLIRKVSLYFYSIILKVRVLYLFGIYGIVIGYYKLLILLPAHFNNNRLILVELLSLTFSFRIAYHSIL